LNTEADASELGAQLDAGFNKAVYEMMKGRPDYFKSLNNALNAPGADAANSELDWETYRSRLIHQFEVSPVFGQEDAKISLSQLYLPLRARWYEKATKEDQGVETTPRVVHLVDMHTEVEKWIEKPEKDRLVKLVCGGPGSGKSSFAKAIAANLARRSDRRPLLIELQHLSFEDRLEDEIPEFLINKLEVFRESPLNKNFCDARRPFVFIFDGLDELARPGGKGADEIARDFATRLERLMDRLNGEKEIRAIAIVTGRNPIIQALQKRADGLNPRDVLETVGYAPASMDVPGEKQSELELLDQRPKWWFKYANATGKNSETPDAFKSEKLRDLTNEPLLCYLLAYSDYATENWEEAGENPNRIYETLLSRVWERGWGGGPEGPVKALRDQKDFDVLMETMALATWQGDARENRVATAENFKIALSVTGAHEAWDRFQRDDGGDVSNLALTFYFKRSDKDSQGFEFTHKSFSEYLVARLLFRIATELADDVIRGRLGHDALLGVWLKLAGPSHISEYMVPFLHNEARSLELNELKLIREALEALFVTIIHDGLPAHNTSPGTWRRAEDQQRNGEINLLACLNCIVRVLFELEPKTNRLKFQWGEDSTAPAKFLRRLIASNGAQVFAYLGLSHINYSGDFEKYGWFSPFMTSMFLPMANLDQTCFDGAILAGSFMRETSLLNASLRNLSAWGAEFDEAVLDRANLEGSTLHHSRFEGASLKGANLKGANLKGANFNNANLEGANLENANLEDAELVDAIFSGVIVKNANLPKNWRKLVVIDKDNKTVGRPKPKSQRRRQSPQITPKRKRGAF
ncbi:MAG: pentapeptide repeat-containing protein, partial [Rhodospirillales bacterium]|nr:pentapeptide repeat-containing protein [Rhodospirillales bacterium]